MQISKGVEWAAHAAALMVALPEGRALRADALARYHDVPSAYMAKQLQALSKAGIVISTRGARGGYRLAKTPANISLLDILTAIEGRASAFRCTEIRQNGPCPARKDTCKTPCIIAKSFHTAEQVFRENLATVTLVDISMDVVTTKTPDDLANVMDWIMRESVEL